MYPHRIRLHGPWQFEPLTRTVVHPDGRIEERPGSVPGSGRMTIPATWTGTVLDGFRGRVRWRRNFHSPRTLEPHEQLWLVFEGVDYFADVSLNGTRLGRHEGYFDPFAYSVTGLVRNRNELVVEVDCPAEADPHHRRLVRGSLEDQSLGFVAGLWRDVALEVRSVAFLRDVLVQASLDGPRGTIAVSGRVVGEPGNRLGMELSVNGTWMAGREIEASAAEMEFQMEVIVEPAELWWPPTLGPPKTYAVLLELHGNARTLDSVERRIGFRQLAFDSRLTSVELNGRQLKLIHVEIEPTSQPLELAKEVIDRLLTTVRMNRSSVVLGRVAGRVMGPGLYDMADSNGLLLWQDFPVAVAHPADPAFEAETVRQATAMVRLLGSHPSIAIWGDRWVETGPPSG